MATPVVRTFRSDVSVMIRPLAKLAIAGTILIVLAAVVGQWRAGRFPCYRELGEALILVPVAFVVVGLFLYAAAFLFPVKLLPDGLRCYDAYGRYRSVKWVDVNDIEIVSVVGLDYVAINASKIKQPITLPLFLKDMDGFRALVEAQLGPTHKIVLALRAPPN